MEFRILGPLEVHTEGRPLEVRGFKQRALLALLLLAANRVVARDALIDALWEDDPPATVHKSLQVYVSYLRKLLGHERVATRPPGYLLRVEPDELDLDRFRRLQAEGELDEALALWRGPPLAEFARERFAQPEIGRLEELRLACLEQRGERELARGAHAELVGELEGLVQEHPLREPLRAQLMLSLYRAGRQADALEAYRAARSALVDELGIEPGRRLRELQQAILEQDPELDLPAAPVAARRPQGAAFVGRAAELAELVGGLDDAFAGHGRLFLLAGEPGIGKSRLAEALIAAAEERGAHVLVGRCWEAGGAPAYWPWVQSLRAYVRASDAATLRAQLGAGGGELAQIVPELRERLPGLPEPASLESEGVRFRLFDATAAFLRAAAEPRPIVLVLDDLHAADASSLLLLQFVARELGVEPHLRARGVPGRRPGARPGAGGHAGGGRSRAGHPPARARRVEPAGAGGVRRADVARELGAADGRPRSTSRRRAIRCSRERSSAWSRVEGRRAAAARCARRDRPPAHAPLGGVQPLPRARRP